MLIKPKKLILLAAVLIVNSATVFTQAKAATYNYMGTHPLNINQGNGQVPLQNEFLSASVTFDSTITSNFTGTVGASDVLSWSVAIGPYAFSSSSPGFLDYAVQFMFNNGVIQPQTAAFVIKGGGVWGPGIPFYNIGTTGQYDLACIGAVFNNCMLSSGVGNWTLETAANTSVPEPNSPWLLLIGLSSLGLLRLWQTPRLS